MANEYYIGIMSGTSLDGVDVAYCEINKTSCRLISGLEYPMPSTLKKDLMMMIQNKISLETIGKLDHRLAQLFSKAVTMLIKRESINPSTVRAIGLHGQTLWHQPLGRHGFTMQLGDPNIVTAQTSIPVVADFRRKDIALGGQGAPFAPAFHEFFFMHKNHKIAVINIGGMANITILDKLLLGYDTGCGNVLLDLWILKHKSLAYDKDGRWAESGVVDFSLLQNMLDDAYFTQAYPKSTGREKFNQVWLDSYLCDKIYNPEDIQRTLLELTAVSIVNEIKQFKRKEVLLCGGGAKNKFLVQRIQSLLVNVKVNIAHDADYIEAMTFAWLAYKRIHHEKVNLKDVTGARENTILGGIYA